MQLLALLPLLAAAPALTQAPVAPRAYHIGPIRVAGLRAEPIGAGAYAVYGPILNIGVRTDALTGVSSPAASAATIVRGRRDPGLEPRIALPPGRPVTLAPWTSHIELSGVAVSAGGTIPLTLQFEDAGTLQASAAIAKGGKG